MAIFDCDKLNGKNRFKLTGNCVVHVETEEFDILHVQWPIHENSKGKMRKREEKTQN